MAPLRIVAGERVAPIVMQMGRVRCSALRRVPVAGKMPFDKAPGIAALRIPNVKAGLLGKSCGCPFLPRGLRGMTRRMSIASVSAISVMVAPVVLLSASATLLTGVLNAYANVTNRVFRMTRERVGALSGPSGELLGAASVPDADRERLIEIDEQMPMVLRRARRLRMAAIVLYCDLAFLVLGVIAIGVADTSDSPAFGDAALGLVLAATVALFSAVALAAALLFRSNDALEYEASRTRKLTRSAAKQAVRRRTDLPAHNHPSDILGAPS